MTRPRRRALLILLVVVTASAGYAVARIKRDFYDFEVYRTAGVRVLDAEPLYRPDEDGHYTFKYWPAFAVAMTPFALVHVEAGKVIWFGLSVALLALFFRQSVQALPAPRLATSPLVWITLLLTGKFIVKELVNGQTNTLFGVLILAAVVAARERRTLAAGALVGLAVLVKPYALLFFPWLLVSEGLVAASAAALVTFAGLALPAAIYGWRGNLELLAAWYRNVTESTPATLLFAENISLVTTWAKWIGLGPASSAMALITAMGLLALAVLLYVRRRTVAEPKFLEVSYLLLIVPLLSPQGWDYVLLLGVPAIMLVVDRFGTAPPFWRGVAILAFFFTSFTIYDLVGRTMYFFLMNISAATIGAVLIGLWLVRLRWRAAA